MAKARGKEVLDALVDAVAGICELTGPSTPDEAGKRVLWSHAADDQFVPVDAEGQRAAYGVFRAWGGPDADNGLPAIAVQAYANAPAAAAMFDLLEQMHNALLRPEDDEEAPGAVQREWAIPPASPAFVVSVLSLSPPALIGSDDQQRIDGSFNFALVYRPAEQPEEEESDNG